MSYEIAESDAESETGIEEAFCGLLGRAGVSLKLGQGDGPLHAGYVLHLRHLLQSWPTSDS